ncbi:MAG: glycosyltransferase [Bacteroidia bacterium]
MKTQKIKVCHFSSVHSIYDTRVFERECVWLAKYYDVTLIAIGNFKGTKNGVKIIGVKKTSKPWHRFFSNVWIVFAKAIKTNAKIYHIHDAELLPFALLLKIFGKKVFYDIHENTKADIIYKTWVPDWQKRILIGFYDLLLRLSSKYIHFIPVVWKPDDAEIFHCKPNNFTIVQNFADIEILRKFRVENRELLPENNIFYIGMLKDMYYDIYKLFDAMLLLKQEGINTHLHCVGYFGIGENDDFKYYKKWNEVKDLVSYYGKLNFMDAYEISKECKVGICLKNQPEGMVVSHERKLFEYMAIGLPAIYCNASIYIDISEKYQSGICCNLENPFEIKEALKLLFLDKNLSFQISKNQIKISDKEINWQKEFNKLLISYQSEFVSI